MNNQEKLEKLLNAISSVEDFEDGSIIIQWKSNVAHEVNGLMLFNSSDSCVVSGQQVHINPAISIPVTQMKHSEVNKELQLAVEREQQKAAITDDLEVQEPCDCDCGGCNEQSQVGVEQH